MMNDKSGRLIITGSFNALLDRLAKLDFFDVWLTGSKILKKAKKDRIEAIMRMSEILAMTGLMTEDVELFVSLRFISVVEAGSDPLLSFQNVFALLKVFERLVDEGAMYRGSVS